MAATLRATTVTFDLQVQVQTHPRRMPIEHAGIVWPDRLSPPVTVAALHLAVQRFDSPEQLAFADALSYNPWHSLPEHRPLGNQNRARKAIYSRLAEARQRMNHTSHVEPTGQEQFPA
jgi:hypothetical protein